MPVQRTVCSVRLLQHSETPRKMTLVFFLNLDCLSECEEIIFVLKCLVVTVLALGLMLFYRILTKL